jgi:hypothetical protein
MKIRIGGMVISVVLLSSLATARAENTDGRECEWLSNCVLDEEIFTGPACQSAAQCAPGYACQEGHCFAGLGTPESEAILDGLTGTRVTTGNSVTPIVEASEAFELWLEARR